MSTHRFTWTLAAFLGVGLGAYEGLRRYRGGGKAERRKRAALIDSALDACAIPLTRADFDAYAASPRTAQVEAEDVTELANWRERAA